MLGNREKLGNVSAKCRRDYAAIAWQYAEDVISGARTAGKLEKQMVQRFYRWTNRDDLTFSARKLEKVCAFVELMPHIEGKWADRHELIQLSPFQVFIIANVYGWLNSAGFRVIRSVYVEMARKNAKSTFVAALCAYELAFGESGAQVVTAATKKSQANIVFNIAKTMLIKSPEIRAKRNIRVRAFECRTMDKNGTLIALAADADTLDGLNLNFSAVDELHAHPNAKLFNVLKSADGSRDEPLMFVITTAGFDLTSICYEHRLYAEQVLELDNDDSLFAAIYTLDDPLRWFELEEVKKANPNFGISVSEDGLIKDIKTALQSPKDQANFKVKKCCLWGGGGAVGWLDSRAWGASGLKVKSAEFIAKLKRARLWIGCDMASRNDFAAVCGLFELPDNKLYAKFGFWAPNAAAEGGDTAELKRQKINGLAQWVKDGFIAVQGEFIELTNVAQAAKELSAEGVFQRAGFDLAQAAFVSSFFGADKSFAVPQTATHLSAPINEIATLVSEGRLLHDDNPVMQMAVANVKLRADQNGCFVMDKSKRREKIDGASALVNAVAVYMADMAKTRKMDDNFKKLVERQAAERQARVLNA